MLVPYEIIPFEVVNKNNTSVKDNLTGLLSDSPTSFHISEERFGELVRAGWNKTVLPKYKYSLDGAEYNLPEVPPYSEWVRHCTCTNKKKPLIEATDTESDDTLKFCFTESCPINMFYALVGRQCGARVNADKDIMDRFGIFSDWVNTEIVRKMKQDKFEINFSESQIEEYL